MQRAAGQHRLVREPADLVQRHSVRRHPRREHPPAGRPEIDAGDDDRRNRRTKSSQERRRHARVDGDEQAGRERQVAAAQREHGGGDVLGQHLALQEGPLTRRTRPSSDSGTPYTAARDAPHPAEKIPDPRTTPSGLIPLTRTPIEPSSAASSRT